MKNSIKKHRTGYATFKLMKKNFIIEYYIKKKNTSTPYELY